MPARFIHPGDDFVIADDPNTIYVYKNLALDEVRLVGKNGIDIVSFIFQNGVVTVNGCK